MAFKVFSPGSLPASLLQTSAGPQVPLVSTAGSVTSAPPLPQQLGPAGTLELQRWLLRQHQDAAQESSRPTQEFRLQFMQSHRYPPIGERCSSRTASSAQAPGSGSLINNGLVNAITYFSCTTSYSASDRVTDTHPPCHSPSQMSNEGKTPWETAAGPLDELCAVKKLCPSC